MAAGEDDRWMGAWLGFLRTHARLWGRVESQLRRDHGLTVARYDVLATLHGAGGRLRMNELGASIVLSPSGLSKLLDRMEASGLIRREPDPGDARSTFAVITPRGRALVRAARRGHHELLQRTFGVALDERDVDDLSRIMARIDASMRDDDPTPDDDAS